MHRCVACLTLLSLPTWAQGEGSKPNPPLARLPVYESGFTSLAAIPLLYPRRWATADLLQVWLPSEHQHCTLVGAPLRQHMATVVTGLLGSLSGS